MEGLFKGRLFGGDAVMKKYVKFRGTSFVATRDSWLLIIRKNNFELVRELMDDFKRQQKEERDHLHKLFPENKEQGFT